MSKERTNSKRVRTWTSVVKTLEIEKQRQNERKNSFDMGYWARSKNKKRYCNSISNTDAHVHL